MPVKGDKAGEGALRLACTLAKEPKAKVYVTHVIEVSLEFPLDAEVDSSAGEDVLNRVDAVVEEEDCGAATGFIQARHAGPAIVQDAAEKGAELIIMGIAYHRRFGSFTFGKTSSYVLAHAPCPVILWKEHIEEPDLDSG